MCKRQNTRRHRCRVPLCAWLRRAVVVAFLAASGEAAAGENLLRNGSFDDGETRAAHWERANGLTTFFVRAKGRGRVVKMDTQVERNQALAWMERFAADPTLQPPEKKPVGRKSYGTIGAVEGVRLDSEFIPAKKGQNYKLTADIKSRGKPIVWIKGFMRHPRRDAYVDAYQTRLVPGKPSPAEWRTFTVGFNPTKRTPRVEKFKVRLYAYWPNGIYYFDNIRVEPITEEEMAELLKAREED